VATTLVNPRIVAVVAVVGALAALTASLIPRVRDPRRPPGPGKSQSSTTPILPRSAP